jgi:hypothetical protein
MTAIGYLRGNPVYQFVYCENNNDLPFAASDGISSVGPGAAGSLGKAVSAGSQIARAVRASDILLTRSV